MFYGLVVLWLLPLSPGSIRIPIQDNTTVPQWVSTALNEPRASGQATYIRTKQDYPPGCLCLFRRAIL
jgi:hypothetical protein